MQTPVTTWWVFPLSMDSMWWASAASAGFPSTLPSHITTVSGSDYQVVFSHLRLVGLGFFPAAMYSGMSWAGSLRDSILQCRAAPLPQSLCPVWRAVPACAASCSPARCCICSDSQALSVVFICHFMLLTSRRPFQSGAICLVPSAPALSRRARIRAPPHTLLTYMLASFMSVQASAGHTGQPHCFITS